MTIKTIKSGGTPGVDCDYTTVQSWFNACPSDITATGTNENWIGELVNECFVAGQVLSATGKTTDSTHYVELRAAATYSFRDNANKTTNALKYNASNGCGIRTSGTNYYAPCVTSNIHLRLTNIQIRNEDYTAGTLNSDSNFIHVTNCIVDTTCLSFNANGGNIIAKNSLFLIEGSGGTFSGMKVASASEIYNCTLAIFSDSGDFGTMTALDGNSSTAIAKNFAVFGGVFTNCGSMTFTTCGTDQSTKPTGFTQYTYANCFENTAKNTRDFRLKSGSPLIDVGTTDSTNAANDIINTARPSGSAYDIGAWEYISAVVAARRNLLLRVG